MSASMQHYGSGSWCADVAVVCLVVHYTPSLPRPCSSVPAGGGCRALLQRGRDRRQQDLAATSPSRHTTLPHYCRSASVVLLLISSDMQTLDKVLLAHLSLSTGN